MNLARPIYQAIRMRHSLYQSSCAFSDVIYTGKVRRKKKEAKQLAARPAVLSLLDASESGSVIANVVNYKIMLRAARAKEQCSIQTGTMPEVVQTGYAFGTEKDAQVNVPPSETQSSSEGYGLLYAYPECR